MFRRERREVPIDPVVHQPVASELSAEEALESAEMVEELRAAREYFSSVVLPAIAEKIRLPYRAGFQQAILQLTEIAEERSNVDEIVRREFGDVSKATRDRLYQQHSRARRYLMDWIERDLPGLEVSDLRAAALRALVAQFRARPVAARSVTGGK